MYSEYKAAFSKIGIELTELTYQNLYQYATLIQQTNKVMNLTAVDDDAGILWRHFIDSCQLFRYISITKSDRIADIGSGAGFPGMPLAIVSGAQTTLVDALNKRIDFLNGVIDELELNNVEALHDRAESFARRPEYRESFDYVFCRAVTELPVLIEYVVPLLKVGGRFIAYKSSDINTEVGASKNALKQLNSKITEIFEYTDNNNVLRTLVCIEKLSATVDKYPRRVGIPAKRPL